MKHPFSFRSLSVLGALSVVGLAFASCTVDKSGLTFDDDEFARVSGEDDGDSGTGGTGARPGGDVGGAGGEEATGGTGGTSVTGGSSAPCESSDLRCNGAQVEICTGESWIAAGGECDFACQAGQCTGVCVPGTSECVSDIEEKVCDELGQWDAGFCQFACVDGACGGECLPGNSRCGGEGGTDIERCSTTGEWEFESACASECEVTTFGQVTSAACTGSCPVDPTSQCILVEGKPAQEDCPSLGSWGDPENVVTECPFEVCLGGQCTGVCVPGTKECGGTAGAPTSRTCDSAGQWLEPIGCDFVCLEATGSCGGVCEPGDARCMLSEKDSPPDLVQTCNENGQWVTDTDCGEKGLRCIVVKEQRTCGECNPPAQGELPQRRCEFNMVQACDAEGIWVDESECAKQACYQGACFSLSSNCPSDVPTGCLEPETGWVCTSRGDPPKVGSCDCRSGQTCAE